MRSFLLLAAIATVTVACDFHLGGQTDGTHGNAEFSYSSCFLGCTAATPMMLADQEHVTVSGSIPGGVSAQMTAPQIVSIKSASRTCCRSDAHAGSVCHTLGVGDACASGERATLDIVVDAAAVGSSDLVIKKSDGSTWDSVTLSVEMAASLAFACNPNGPNGLAQSGSVTVANGLSCPISWQATDGSGKPLMSTSGVDVKTSDPAVVGLASEGLLGTLGAKLQTELEVTPQLFGGASIMAVAPGDATVTATGGGRTESLSVHVNP